LHYLFSIEIEINITIVQKGNMTTIYDNNFKKPNYCSWMKQSQNYCIHAKVEALNCNKTSTRSHRIRKSETTGEIQETKLLQNSYISKTIEQSSRNKTILLTKIKGIS